MRHLCMLLAGSLCTLASYANAASPPAGPSSQPRAVELAEQAFHRGALQEAVDQLDSYVPPSTSVPVGLGLDGIGTTDAGEDGGTAAAASQGDWQQDHPVRLEPTKDTPATCTNSTCSQFTTCGGGSTCTNTCDGGASSWPTCDGRPSMCAQSTCASHPTCNGGGATMCESTCQNFETCGGGGLATSQCSASCQSQPTCFTTCTGSGATCGASSTCTATCNGSVSCDNSSTCTRQPCNPTDNAQVSCSSNGPPSYCADTCSSQPTRCAGTTCRGSCSGSPPPLAMLGDGPWSALLLGLGSILVIRRRKVEGPR